MNHDRFAGICRQFGGMMKQGWGKLTHDPRAVKAGMHEQFAGKIQERHGILKEEAARQLEDFHERNRNWNLTSR